MAPDVLDGIEDMRTVVEAAADASPEAAAAAERVKARLDAYLLGKLSADQALGLTDAARHRWRCDRARRHFLSAWDFAEMDLRKETGSSPSKTATAKRLYSMLQRHSRRRPAARGLLERDVEREIVALVAVKDRPYSGWRSVLQRHRDLVPADDQETSPSFPDRSTARLDAHSQR